MAIRMATSCRRTAKKKKIWHLLYRIIAFFCPLLRPVVVGQNRGQATRKQEVASISRFFASSLALLYNRSVAAFEAQALRNRRNQYGPYPYRRFAAGRETDTGTGGIDPRSRPADIPPKVGIPGISRPARRQH